VVTELLVADLIGFLRITITIKIKVSEDANMLDAPHNKFYTALRHRTDVFLHTLLWWLLAEVPHLGFFLPPRHPGYRRDG
jgi:hypothetical protein